jgi:hypothetical protein
MNRYPFATIHAKIRELSEGRAVPTIDLLPAFTGYMQNELIVHPVDYHPNGHAHKIAALETTRQISRHEK